MKKKMRKREDEEEEKRKKTKEKRRRRRTRGRRGRGKENEVSSFDAFFLSFSLCLSTLALDLFSVSLTKQSGEQCENRKRGRETTAKKKKKKKRERGNEVSSFDAFFFPTPRFLSLSLYRRPRPLFCFS